MNLLIIDDIIFCKFIIFMMFVEKGNIVCIVEVLYMLEENVCGLLFVYKGFFGICFGIKIIVVVGSIGIEGCVM